MMTWLPDRGAHRLRPVQLTEISTYIHPGLPVIRAVLREDREQEQHRCQSRPEQ